MNSNWIYIVKTKNGFKKPKRYTTLTLLLENEKIIIDGERKTIRQFRYILDGKKVYEDSKYYIVKLTVITNKTK